MNLAQNVCLDDFKVMYIFLSSDCLFFRLGQFLSNYWFYRVIFGTCEVIVFRSVSQYMLMRCCCSVICPLAVLFKVHGYTMGLPQFHKRQLFCKEDVASLVSETFQM